MRGCLYYMVIFGYREQLNRGDLVTDWVTLETCDFWDIWSEWWGNMTWPTNQNFYNIDNFDNFDCFYHYFFFHFWKMLKTFDHFLTILTILICFLHFQQIFNFQLSIFTNSIPKTWGLWDTDYNSYNWEPELMTIFETWQLGVTLDSIRNSCDVFLHTSNMRIHILSCSLFFFYPTSSSVSWLSFS